MTDTSAESAREIEKSPGESAEDMNRLVRILASRIIAGLPRDSGIEMSDLIQAGNLGLLQAARTFRPQSGAPLAGYAKFRIRGEMLDTVRRNSRPGPELRRTVSSISPRMRNLAYPASGATRAPGAPTLPYKVRQPTTARTSKAQYPHRWNTLLTACWRKINGPRYCIRKWRVCRPGTAPWFGCVIRASSACAKSARFYASMRAAPANFTGARSAACAGLCRNVAWGDYRL